jgi:hypothetical protein
MQTVEFPRKSTLKGKTAEEDKASVQKHRPIEKRA